MEYLFDGAHVRLRNRRHIAYFLHADEVGVGVSLSRGVAGALGLTWRYLALSPQRVSLVYTGHAAV
jgi:hypothetical protein